MDFRKTNFSFFFPACLSVCVCVSADLCCPPAPYTEYYLMWWLNLRSCPWGLNQTGRFILLGDSNVVLLWWCCIGVFPRYKKNKIIHTMLNCCIVQHVGVMHNTLMLYVFLCFLYITHKVLTSDKLSGFREVYPWTEDLIFFPFRTFLLIVISNSFFSSVFIHDPQSFT